MRLRALRSVAFVFLLTGVSRAADSSYSAARALQEASIEKQRTAVRIQAAAAVAQNPAFFEKTALVLDSALLVEPAPDFDCERAPAGKIHRIVDDGARRSGLDEDLVRAVVRKESAYNPCATSRKGAQGLMQLMPSVQAQFGVTNPYDPRQNVDAGTRLLKQLIDQYGGDLSRALAAYNAGPARVEQWGGVPPIPETMQYVEGILGDLPAK